MTDICITEPKQRGRPKKIKTPEELEEDRKKKNEYHNRYHKERCERDPKYAEKYNQRTKRYAKRNEEKIKMISNLVESLDADVFALSDAATGTYVNNFAGQTGAPRQSNFGPYGHTFYRSSS